MSWINKSTSTSSLAGLFERLTLVEKNLLRLGIFEITSFDTPQLVAVNEAIELAKNFSDQKSARLSMDCLVNL